MAKQTTITIETISLVVLRSRNLGHAWCAQCGAERETVGVHNIGTATPESRALQEWLNSGDLHRSQANDGSTLICLTSLLARVQTTKPR